MTSGPFQLAANRSEVSVVRATQDAALPGAQNGYSANLKAPAGRGQSVELAAVCSGHQPLEDLIVIGGELRDHVDHQVWEGSEEAFRPSASTARPPRLVVANATSSYSPPASNRSDSASGS
jgi:hypothetical protein